MPKVSIAIDVANGRQAVAFYVNALGCKHLRDPYPQMSVVSMGDVEIWLLEKPSGSHPLLGGGAIRSYERHWTPVHLDFRVEDFANTLDRVVDEQGTCESQGESGYRWAFCADPFGNGFCLIEDH